MPNKSGNYNKRLVLGANVLLLALLALTVFYSKARWTRLRQAGRFGVFHMKKVTSPVRKPLGDYSIISRRNIFGVSGKGAGHADGSGESESKLRLKGTLVASPLGSFAIIEDVSTGEQSLYQLGDKVSGAQLIDIVRWQVVLRRESGEEILSISRAAGFSQKILALDERGRVIPRSVIDDAMENANQILSEVRIRPHFEKGAPAGFSLRNIKPDSIVSEMGFLDGDIVKVVNGKRLDNPEEVIAAYNTIKETRTFLVDVEREGRLVRLRYEIEE